MALFNTQKIFRTPAEVMDASVQRTAALGLGQLFQRGMQHAQELRQRDAEFAATMAQRQLEFETSREVQAQQFNQNLAQRQFEFGKTYQQSEDQFSRKLGEEQFQFRQQQDARSREFRQAMEERYWTAGMQYEQRADEFNRTMDQRRYEFDTGVEKQDRQFDLELTKFDVTKRATELSMAAQQMAMDEQKNLLKDMQTIGMMTSYWRRNPAQSLPPGTEFLTAAGAQKAMDIQRGMIEQRLGVVRQERENQFSMKLSPLGYAKWTLLQNRRLEKIATTGVDDRTAIEAFMLSAPLNAEDMAPFANWGMGGRFSGTGTMQQRGAMAWAIEEEASKLESQGKYADAAEVRKRNQFLIDPRGAVSGTLTAEQQFVLRTGEQRIEDEYKAATDRKNYPSADDLKKARETRDKQYQALRNQVFGTTQNLKTEQDYIKKIVEAINAKSKEGGSFTEGLEDYR